MSDESTVEKLRDRAKQAMVPPAANEAAKDPSPYIPTATPASTGNAQVTGAGEVARTRALPAVPRNKECRVIRVKTKEGVVAMINANDYDPEFLGHEALTPEDEKWGKMAVDARQRADYESEKLAAIKRVVRGG